MLPQLILIKHACFFIKKNAKFINKRFSFPFITITLVSDFGDDLWSKSFRKKLKMS